MMAFLLFYLMLRTRQLLYTPENGFYIGKARICSNNERNLVDYFSFSCLLCPFLFSGLLFINKGRFLGFI